MVSKLIRSLILITLIHKFKQGVICNYYNETFTQTSIFIFPFRIPKIAKSLEIYDSNSPATDSRNEFLLNSRSVCFSRIIKMHARNVADRHERNFISCAMHTDNQRCAIDTTNYIFFFLFYLSLFANEKK